MSATIAIKTADKVTAAFRTWKKGALAEELGMSRNTLKARIKTNCWNESELDKLRKLGIIR